MARPQVDFEVNVDETLVRVRCRSDVRHALKWVTLGVLNQCSRIRIFRFFQISKKHDFLRFFEMTLKKKRKKSVAKILSSMMPTLLQKKKKSLLNVYRNLGLKTPGCYGYV